MWHRYEVYKSLSAYFGCLQSSRQAAVIMCVLWTWVWVWTDGCRQRRVLQQEEAAAALTKGNLFLYPFITALLMWLFIIQLSTWCECITCIFNRVQTKGCIKTKHARLGILELLKQLSRRSISTGSWTVLQRDCRIQTELYTAYII